MCKWHMQISIKDVLYLIAMLANVTDSESARNWHDIKLKGTLKTSPEWNFRRSKYKQTDHCP